MGEGTPFARGKKGFPPPSPSFPKTRTYKLKKNKCPVKGWIFPCMELFTMCI